MSYGRHQSFYLKRHWITKGINALNMHGNDILLQNDGFKVIGLGKNMQQSLRFWLEAANVIELKNKFHQLTKFGEYIKKYDLGCNENATKIILHYFLCINGNFKTDNFDTFIWFFNIYNDIYFSKETLLNQLIKNNRGKTSSNTLRRDVDCLINTYTNNIKSHPEDINVSLLSDLGLIIKNDEGSFKKTPIPHDSFSYDAFYYIILLLKEEGYDLTVDALFSREHGIGKLFNLNRMEILNIIETMSVNKKYNMKITRTNNLDVISLDNSLHSDDFLEHISRDK